MTRLDLPGIGSGLTDGVWVLLERLGTSGACVGTDDPERWFPDGGSTDAENDRYASQVCQGCPVQAACLMYAVKTGQTHGIWGGLAEHRLLLLTEIVDVGDLGGNGHPATGIDTMDVA